MNRLIAQQIIHAIGNAEPASIEFIPDAIGRRIKRKNESIVEEPISMRRHERKNLLVSALAIRLSDQLAPIGTPIQVFIKDISASGLGFFHTRHWPECKLAIQLPNPRGEDVYVFVVGTVRRSNCKSGSYEVGIEFTQTFRTDRLDTLPAHDSETLAADHPSTQQEMAIPATSPAP